MWNFSIIVPREFGKIVYELYSNNKKHSDVSFAQTIIQESDSYRYVFAVHDNYKNVFYSSMMNFIADNIVVFYKTKYLQKNIKFNLGENINNLIFFKSLVCFDFDADKSDVMKQIMSENTIYTDSLISFRLKEMKRRWRDLSNLANENFYYLHSESSFKELMRFLISNIDYRTNTVNVYQDDNHYVFFDKNNNLIVDYLLDYPSMQDSFLIGSLIALSPQKIVFHFDIDDLNNKDMIFDLFDERIEI